MNLVSITHLLNGILMIALGVGLGILLTHRFAIGWRLWWIGAATFVISQIGHIPFNIAVGTLLRRGILPSPQEELNLAFTAIFLGLSAGVWEECARYATFRWWAVDARTWRKALVLGAGHGGIEAILLGVVVLYTYLQLLALQGTDLAKIISPDRLEIVQEQVNAYWSIPWYATLLGALERIFALITHLTLSVLVLQAFVRRHIRWLFLAIIWHGMFNAVAYYIARIWGPYLAELALAIGTLLDIGVLYLLRQPEPTPLEEGSLDLITAVDSQIMLPDLDESQESLNQTRYN
jgi:uncharacterized membrane protein YhfC